MKHIRNIPSKKIGHVLVLKNRYSDDLIKTFLPLNMEDFKNLLKKDWITLNCYNVISDYERKQRLNGLKISYIKLEDILTDLKLEE